MFDQLYKRRHARIRHGSGPLAEERRRFLAHLAEQQMSRESLGGFARYTLIVANALHLADRPRELISRREIGIAADCWVSRTPRPPDARKNRRLRARFTGPAVRWLTFLGRLQPPAAVKLPYADHVATFTDYMIRERGLSLTTVEYSRKAIQEFLSQVNGAGLRLKSLTTTDVNDLMSQKFQNGHWSRVSIRRWATSMRPFFRFAAERKWCHRDLAAAIKTPRLFPEEGLPLGPSWDDVNRLLDAARGDDRVDIRDRALLMLLAVYGLRAGEVAALRLEDFEWEREVLTVPRGKRQRPRIYPLCRPVGDAVLRYLQKARPRSDRREVFMTVLAPFRPMANASVGGMVNRRLHALGLTLPHYGAHTLRHACATHLLARGLSLKEIGDHLGHRSPAATRIYAKVDLAALRSIADFTLEGLL